MRKVGWRWRIGCAGMLLLAAFVVSYQDNSEYCRLCGKYRKITFLSPFRLLEYGLILYTQERPTPLSELLEPLANERGLEHEWAASYRCGALFRLTRPLVGMYDGRVLYGRQHWTIYSSEMCFGWLIDSDPDLALRVARALLNPSADRGSATAQEEVLHALVGFGPGYDTGALREATLAALKVLPEQGAWAP